MEFKKLFLFAVSLCLVFTTNVLQSVHAHPTWLWCQPTLGSVSAFDIHSGCTSISQIWTLTLVLQEQHYLFLPVRAVFLCVQRMVWLPLSWVFDVHRCWCMIAHGGCTHTIREVHWKLTCRKIPHYTSDMNLCQYCIGLFSQTLYQLNYHHPTC